MKIEQLKSNLLKKNLNSIISNQQSKAVKGGKNTKPRPVFIKSGFPYIW